MLRLYLVFLCAAFCGAQTPSSLFEILDAPESGAPASLEGLGTTLEEALSLVRAGRELGDARRGHFRTTLTSRAGVESKLEIWLPDSYDPATPAPAMIFLHGLNDKPKSFWPIVGHECARRGWILIMPRAQRLVDAGDLPMHLQLVNTFNHWWSYRADNFGLLGLEWAQRHYNIDTDRVFLGGYSMGGYATWNLGSRFHDRFAGLMVFAGGEVSGTPARHSRDDAYRLLENLASTPVFLSHSREDDVVAFAAAESMLAALDAQGFAYQADIVEGEGHRLQVHGEDNPRNQAAFAFLADGRRDPAPASFHHVALEPEHGAAYNLQLLAWPGAVGEVRCERSDIGYRIDCPSGTELWLYLELDETPTIELNGRTVDAQPEQGWEVLLESWRTHRDPRLCYARRVRLRAE